MFLGCEHHCIAICSLTRETSGQCICCCASAWTVGGFVVIVVAVVAVVVKEMRRVGKKDGKIL